MKKRNRREFSAAEIENIRERWREGIEAAHLLARAVATVLRGDDPVAEVHEACARAGLATPVPRAEYCAQRELLLDLLLGS